MINFGQLNKVRILSFKDKTFRRPSIPPVVFLPINPESYTRNIKINHNKQQGTGNQGTESKFDSTKPEELKLDFIFDGTGSIENYNNNGNDSVTYQIKFFLSAVYNMNGNIHQPNFLILNWGSLVFKCVLSNLDLNYTLFDPNGEPLRAKVSATFLEYISNGERTAKESKNSPDLTHRKIFKAGDRLHNMVDDIYDDSKYILQVAKANNLSSFRSAPIGKQLIFPPLDKTE